MSLVIGKYASSREFRGSERIQALDDCGRLCKEMSASGQKSEMNCLVDTCSSGYPMRSALF